MWVAKRLDFSRSDIAFGLAGCGILGRRELWRQRVESLWSPEGDAVACLSVRSGFDMLLGAAQFPQKSEIIFTALTISDMPRIAEHHGMVPVPIDIDRTSTSPLLGEIGHAVTEHTRAIVVTHLYGSRIDVAPLVEMARQKKLLLIEDCAQAFAGLGYVGHAGSDVTMFSFGPIKTATALGGALLCVRNEELGRRMRERQSRYPVQSTAAYAARLLKYAVLQALSRRLVYGGIWRLLRALGVDHDPLVHGLTRSFSGGGFFRRIRRQPCAALMRLLTRRLQGDHKQLEQRAAHGAELRRYLDPEIVCPGSELIPHYYWVFPIIADDPASVIHALRDAGFDATEGRSLEVVEQPSPGTGANVNARALRAHTVFLPFYPEMTANARARMAAVVNRSLKARGLAPAG